MHLKRVSSTSHDTPASHTRPSVPAGRVRAPRSDRTSRDLDRHLDRRQQRAARHHTRTRAYASATPGITAELQAQAAHGPRSDLARADVVRATLTRATRCATRSPPYVVRSAGTRGSAGPGSTSPTRLPRSYPSGAPEGDSNSAPVSTTGWSRHRSRRRQGSLTCAEYSGFQTGTERAYPRPHRKAETQYRKRPRRPPRCRAAQLPDLAASGEGTSHGALLTESF